MKRWNEDLARLAVAVPVTVAGVGSPLARAVATPGHDLGGRGGRAPLMTRGCAVAASTSTSERRPSGPRGALVLRPATGGVRCGRRRLRSGTWPSAFLGYRLKVRHCRRATATCAGQVVALVTSHGRDMAR